MAELVLATPTCHCWRGTAELFDTLKVCYALQFTPGSDTQPRNPSQPLEKRDTLCRCRSAQDGNWSSTYVTQDGKSKKF